MNEQPQLFAMEQTDLTSDDYYTPSWVFDTLGLRFDLDVASPPHSTNVPADRYYSVLTDGLASPWHGRVWMNPPYSNPTPWVEKFLEHGNGIALLPMPKGCRWLQTLWNSDASLVMSQRIKFHHRGKMTEISFPTAFWAIGADNVEAIAKMGRPR
jgi:hypothetical protein